MLLIIKVPNLAPSQNWKKQPPKKKTLFTGLFEILDEIKPTKASSEQATKERKSNKSIDFLPHTKTKKNWQKIGEMLGNFIYFLLIFQLKSPKFRYHRIEKKNSADNL